MGTVKKSRYKNTCWGWRPWHSQDHLVWWRNWALWNFDFYIKFDLQGQGQSLPKTIGILTKEFCTLEPDLVILAWKDDELSCRQAVDWWTHTHTHTQADPGSDNTRRPKLATGKNVTFFINTAWFRHILKLTLIFSLLSTPCSQANKTSCTAYGALWHTSCHLVRLKMKNTQCKIMLHNMSKF